MADVALPQETKDGKARARVNSGHGPLVVNNVPKPPEFVPGSWSLVLLPDTQNYSERYPGVFTLQTHWIARTRISTTFATCYTWETSPIAAPIAKWRHAQESMSELDGKVPYAIVPGNHDPFGMSKYFPVSKFRIWPTFGGVMVDDNIENSYHLFSGRDRLDHYRPGMGASQQDGAMGQ